MAGKTSVPPLPFPGKAELKEIISRCLFEDRETPLRGVFAFVKLTMVG